MELLEQVRSILAEYADYLPLTVRQVFYRLVGVHGYDKTEQAARLRGIRVLHASPSSLRAGLRLFSATARDRGPKPQAAQPPARRGSNSNSCTTRSAMAISHSISMICLRPS